MDRKQLEATIKYYENLSLWGELKLEEKIRLDGAKFELFELNRKAGLREHNGKSKINQT